MKVLRGRLLLCRRPDEPPHENDKRQDILLKKPKVIAKRTFPSVAGDLGIMIGDDQVLMRSTKLFAIEPHEFVSGVVFYLSGSRPDVKGQSERRGAKKQAESRYSRRTYRTAPKIRVRKQSEQS
ncbi:hypothetical protein JYP46_05340 [Nitratireductor aquimarinus]|uniref:hypothetical protein n=1 Tax=Alphaproteobacteria TaxID=28211 RepID=UPI0019D3FD45|nr:MULTISPECIES: hypothetical protein [Alphaproteobacteria]MBN7756238.1 hypothetical protein [Nitratireductor aquimarinus]MBY5998997.1 hypothetical protein [Tritonibacter mobilis]MBY6021024.1 hypothetical protein [Nitratireductor sp. DP7N14-4]